MKKNYTTKLGLYVLIFLAITKLSGQQTYTFTNCGATGSVGPTQLQVNTAYATTNLAGLVTTTISGIQTWTAPYTGNFRIEARGAQGGTYINAGGLGAIVAGDFSLTAGEVIRILVGQKGEDGGTGPGSGAGGSFVVRFPYNTNASILAIAGGGTGDGSYLTAPGLTTTAGGTGGVAGGINGLGGLGGTRGAGGGGFFTDGDPCSVSTNYANPGQAFVNGGRGGALSTLSTCGFTASGGFGGGSSHGGNCIQNGGAGGGYSGGGGSSNTVAGGGGSYNSGTSQVNTQGVNAGHGRVIITELCSVRAFAAGGTNSVSPALCSGNSLTLTTDAVSNFSWSTGATTNSIVVAPGTNTVYSITGTSSLNCTATGVISVTVSAGLPVLSISNPSNNICTGRTVSLTASGALTYTWANPGIVNGQNFTPLTTAAYTVTGQNGCGTTVATTTITVAPLPVTASTSPTLVCQGYTAALSANSAVSGYTWQPNNFVGANSIVAPLANTVYTVTASDGTCTGTAMVLVTTKTTPTLNATASSSMICEGNVVTIGVSGAGPGGTYTWDQVGGTATSFTAMPLMPTLYSVTGTNTLNCTSSTQQVVVVMPRPAIVVSADKTLICNGDQSILSASGATAYTWTGGPASANYTITPTSAAVYTVSGVGANGCSATRTIGIGVITPNISAPTTVTLCSGNSVTITASGASTYSWNGVYGISSYLAMPLTNTTVVLTTNSSSMSLVCTSTRTINLNVSQNPTVIVTPSKPEVCRNESVTLTASGATSYNWGALGNSASVVVAPSALTFYQVTGTDANGCQGVTNFGMKMSNCTGLSEQQISDLLMVYPNPNAGSFIITADQDLKGQIYNNLGQVVRTFSLDGNVDHKLQISDLSNGVYYIVAEKDGRSFNEKIIVAK